MKFQITTIFFKRQNYVVLQRKWQVIWYTKDFLDSLVNGEFSTNSSVICTSEKLCYYKVRNLRHFQLQDLPSLRWPGIEKAQVQRSIISISEAVRLPRTGIPIEELKIGGDIQKSLKIITLTSSLKSLSESELILWWGYWKSILFGRHERQQAVKKPLHFYLGGKNRREQHRPRARA